MLKVKICPKCKGCGFISISTENSIGARHCYECNGKGVIAVPMTNGDVIRSCNNEQLVIAFENLNTSAIYSEEKNRKLLFFNNPDDCKVWLDKKADALDMRTIFNFINEEEHDKEFDLARANYE